MTTTSPPPVDTDFAGLGVPSPLVTSLARHGVDTPFPIQAAALPDALEGRDVLGRARTGSGKTLAFTIPVVVRLQSTEQRRTPRRPRALVLVPTRELAAQVRETVDMVTAGSNLRATTIHGGVAQGPQVAALRRGVDVCVATPGRLEDLIGQGHLSLDSVEITIIDEADHMADLGFLPAVRRLLDRTPPGGQRLLFSATMDRDVDVLVRRYLNDPVSHSVDPVDGAVSTQEHHLLTVDTRDKAAITHELLSGDGRTLAFTRTKHAAKKLARRLSESGIPAADLHGNLSQSARTRNLAAFHSGSVRVLVATDIAARGIHVDDVRLVVHVDPPTEPKAYLHRSGRTARAGANGVVVTVATRDQRSEVASMLRKADIRATERSVRQGNPSVAELSRPQTSHSSALPDRGTANPRARRRRRRPSAI